MALASVVPANVGPQAGRKTIARKDAISRGRPREDLRKATPERGTFRGASGSRRNAWSRAEPLGLKLASSLEALRYVAYDSSNPQRSHL